MRDIPYCPLKYIRSINGIIPTANGKFAIEAGPGIVIQHIPNGIKIKSIEVIPNNPIFRIESNNLSALTPSDYEYIRDGSRYYFRGAYLPSDTPYYQWEDIVELVDVADSISDTGYSDNGTIRFLTAGVLNAFIQMDADTNDDNAISAYINNTQYTMTNSTPTQIEAGVYRDMAYGTFVINASDEVTFRFLGSPANNVTQTITNVKIYIDFKPIPE